MKKQPNKAAKRPPAGKPAAKRPGKPRARAAAVSEEEGTAYVFRLFVTGGTERSARAINNIKAICEENFSGQYQLEVVDVYQQPEVASGEQIVAIPTLVKKAPGRVQKILGDIGNSKEFVKKLR